MRDVELMRSRLASNSRLGSLLHPNLRLDSGRQFELRVPAATPLPPSFTPEEPATASDSRTAALA